MPITVYPSTNNPRLVKKLWIFTQGAWRPLKGVFIFSGGGWRKLYSSEFDPITIGGGTDVNLRDQWRGRYPGETPTGRTVITVAGNCIASSTGSYALRTGGWPSDVELFVNINPGVVIAGRGGGGGCSGGGGGTGGPAILVEHPVTFNNFGVVGGGGGGGGGTPNPPRSGGWSSGGGGGGGYGAAGCTTSPGNRQASAGDLINGGLGGQTYAWSGRVNYFAGDGGSLGNAGGASQVIVGNRGPGGGPGCSIIGNGYPYSLGGDVRGPRC